MGLWVQEAAERAGWCRLKCRLSPVGGGAGRPGTPGSPLSTLRVSCLRAGHRDTGTPDWPGHVFLIPRGLLGMGLVEEAPPRAAWCPGCCVRLAWCRTTHAGAPDHLRGGGHPTYLPAGCWASQGWGCLRPMRVGLQGPGPAPPWAVVRAPRSVSHAPCCSGLKHVRDPRAAALWHRWGVSTPAQEAWQRWGSLLGVESGGGDAEEGRESHWAGGAPGAPQVNLSPLAPHFLPPNRAVTPTCPVLDSLSFHRLLPSPGQKAGCMGQGLALCPCCPPRPGTEGSQHARHVSD